MREIVQTCKDALVNPRDARSEGETVQVLGEGVRPHLVLSPECYGYQTDVEGSVRVRWLAVKHQTSNGPKDIDFVQTFSRLTHSGARTA